MLTLKAFILNHVNPENVFFKPKGPGQIILIESRTTLDENFFIWFFFQRSNIRQKYSNIRQNIRQNESKATNLQISTQRSHDGKSIKKRQKTMKKNPKQLWRKSKNRQKIMKI